MKYFNITGSCNPDENYMVDMSDRVSKIAKMVEQGKYITINRGRQYGKTTILSLLEEYLSEEYVVYFVSFEGMDSSMFETAKRLAYCFFDKLKFAYQFEGVRNTTDEMRRIIEEYLLQGEKNREIDMTDFSIAVSRLCTASSKPIVIMIDEVDKAGEYEAFIDLLGFFRSKYLKRRKAPTFKSVILASVYNIKNLKLKLRKDDEAQYNSPWNIAEAFEADMSFSSADIRNMLEKYDKEHSTGMDTELMAQLIYDYTSGYPFLVSKLCKILDEEEHMLWDKASFLEATKRLLNEENTLFDDMNKKLSSFPEMKDMFRRILYNGYTYPFVIDDEVINIAFMFGYIKNVDGTVQISNRIFETRLYNLFVFEESKTDILYKEALIDKNRFVKGDELDMEHILECFARHFNDVYGDKDEKFREKEGRKFFMFYIKPIINGVGNYYIEAQTRDETRTDMVIDYKGQQYVIEMKIWRGREYHIRGEKQLREYLDYFKVDKGYMISFNFNKKKEIGVHTIELEGKTIVETVV